MGKKGRQLEVEDVLAQPWCYYCERTFDDLKILISHQKAKHFKCDRCGRRLNTAGGLSVHLSQVHKEQLNEVENALPERMTLGVEIFGMEGIPEDVKARHDKRVAEDFWKELAERREATGNPPAGSKEALVLKPSKFADEEDLAKRFKEHMNRVKNGEVPPSTAMEGVQPTSVGIPPSFSPDQAQAYAAPPFAQPPMGFPPGQAPYAGQPGFQQPTFAGSPPFAQPLYQAPGHLPSRPAFQQPPGVPYQQHGAPGQLPHVHDAVDDLIARATAAALPALAPPTEAKAAAPEKKGKEKNTRLMYSDNEISPEEKMAAHPKYAYAKA